MIKKIMCSSLGHKIANQKKINEHVTRFQCSRCNGDFAINFMIEGGLLPWDDVKELYEDDIKNE